MEVDEEIDEEIDEPDAREGRGPSIHLSLLFWWTILTDIYATAPRKAKEDALNSRSVPLRSLDQHHPNTSIDWVETGRRKNQAEGTGSNEKTPKGKQTKGSHTKAAKPGGTRTKAAKPNRGRAKTKGGGKRTKGMKPILVLVLTPCQLTNQ